MRYAIITWCLLWNCLAKAQEPGEGLPGNVQQLIEAIAANSEEEHVDIQALYNIFETLLEHPVNLNTATENELQQLQLLTDFQIQSLLDYRKQYGKLFTIHELPLIHGFNEELAAQLYPFVIVVPATEQKAITFRDRFTRGNHQFIARTGRTLEQQQGYRESTPEELAIRPNSRYLGLPWAFYARYRYTYKTNTRWGFTAKNDAGEPFFTGNNRYGFDFYSAHVQLSDMGAMKQLIIGDYQVQFGQGLVIWGGYSLSKTGDVLAIKKQERGLTSYTSTNENLFQRGAAVTFQYKQWRLSAFFSHKNIDASGDSSGFSSLQTSGLHNTVSTMAGKHSLPETVAGGNISYRFKQIKVGITGLWHHYGKGYERDIRPYNQFELALPHNANIGIDFYGVWQKTSIFGEGAVSANGGLAGIIGMLLDLHHAFCLSMLYRHYAVDYQAMYAQGFGETGKTANENGCYIGAQWLPRPDITVSAYADVYSFPWMRFRSYAPSNGFDYWLQVDYRPEPHVGMYLRLKQKIKDENSSGSSAAVTPLQTINTLHIRYGITYELLEGLKMQDRIEFSSYTDSRKETGWLLYHDIKYHFKAFPVNTSVRFAVFDTDSWNTRFYAYEDDILYAFSVPAYHLKGARWYVNLHLKLGKNIDFWGRLAQSYYFNATTVSDGLAQIDKPRQTALKMQISVKF